MLDELAKQEEFKKTEVKFGVCEAEDLADVSLRYKIEAAPTILYFRSGKVIDRVDGADVGQLTAKTKQYSSDKQPTSKVNLEERLKQLINKHNVVIFMKGDRKEPRCGFSKQLIHIINETG